MIRFDHNVPVIIEMVIVDVVVEMDHTCSNNIARYFLR